MAPFSQVLEPLRNPGRFIRIPRLIEDLTRAGAQSRKSAFFRALAKVDLLVLDDFALTPLADTHRHDLLEILDPVGHLKIPHLWPAQNPPAAMRGTD